ncbi:DUF3263 domain-containing protein [Blastococcus sp. TML/M2B]|uniref:DUF3263 domain-containing protein n=1 Tax=unclassified Blastococcus TaxID=2619396 RepID=UPI00190AF3E6|nr:MULTISPECIES: DUF3263 domain-containing protein [unclassified Blastococcus]MBN1091455.1 DUF3263 domain-containing protein [Blastococcus sp. TML/M2B]MBN1094989.1 DUF3263 domain-containing protein [Blastococcus sp. TML/C7B]
MSTDLSAAPAAGAEDDAAEAPAAVSSQVGGPDLSAREQEMLAFERQWWRVPGAKETAIRDHFELSPTRYYQVLNALVDRPAALAADPLLVRRLRRVRAARQRTRPSRVLGKESYKH